MNYESDILQFEQNLHEIKGINYESDILQWEQNPLKQFCVTVIM